MNNGPENDPKKLLDEFSRKIDERESRKLKGRRDKPHNVWFGLGMFGMIGWSVAIPTLIGIAIGVWIDTRYPSQYSWTLMFLILGVIVGCINAWLWLKKEGRIEK